MEIIWKRRRIFPLEKIYPTCFQLYLYPPNGDVSLEEFEELASLRQRVLHEISNVRERQNHGDLTEDVYKSEIWKCTKLLSLENHSEDFVLDLKGKKNDIDKQIADLEMKVQKHLSQRQRDHISHYILRLAYCRSEELRRLFLAQEVELMRYRLLKAGANEREQMIRRYPEHLPLKRVTIPTEDMLEERRSRGVSIPDEDQLLSEEMDSVYGVVFTVKSEETKPGPLKPIPTETSTANTTATTTTTATARSVDFYQVKFTEVLDLVQHREVVLKGGHAYLPLNSDKMVVSYICNKFRSLLSQDLVRMLSHVLSVVDQDERITPLLKSMRYKYTGADFSTGSGVDENISLRQLDTLSCESFAPCMRHLHETLRKEHHLRHFGRLQYGLFLKSINLTLDQALTFWKEEFTKKMEPDKFDKQYAYNIRHSFGKEGKRTNYTPYSCMKIIMSNAPGPGDHHGCPFRHWDETHIQDMLSSYGVPLKSIQQIMTYVQSSHYHLACQKYFDITHKLEQSVFSLEHPSQYFFESRKIRRGQNGAVAPEVKKESQPDVEKDHNIDMSEEGMKDFEDMEV